MFETKEKMGIQMMKAYFNAPNCVCVCLYLGQFKSQCRSITCACAGACASFFVPEKLSIRPIRMNERRSHSDTEEMLLCSNFP